MIKLFITGLLLTGFCGLAIGQKGTTVEAKRVFLSDKSYSLGINSQFAIDGLLDPGTFTPIEFLLRRGLPGNRSLRLRARGWVENTNKIEGEENRKIQHPALPLPWEMNGTIPSIRNLATILEQIWKRVGIFTIRQEIIFGMLQLMG